MQAFQYSAFNMNLATDINLSYFSRQVAPDIFEPFKYSFNQFNLYFKDNSSYFSEPKPKHEPNHKVKSVKQKKKTSNQRTEIMEPSYIEYKRKRSK